MRTWPVPVHYHDLVYQYCVAISDVSFYHSSRSIIWWVRLPRLPEKVSLPAGIAQPT